MDTGQKVVIIINGKGGSGKDTVCDILGRYYPTTVVSSVSKVKQAARLIFGWKGGKEDKDRKFLSDLKDLWTEYNDGPYRYLCDQMIQFLNKPATCFNQIMMVHIREPQEIEKFKKACNMCNVPVKTLLISSDRTQYHEYGNQGDDGVDKYEYDHIYNNDGALTDLENDFMTFFTKEMMPEWLDSH